MQEGIVEHEPAQPGGRSAPPGGTLPPISMRPGRNHHRRLHVTSWVNIASLAAFVLATPIWLLARVMVCSGPGGDGSWGFELLCKLDRPLTGALLVTLLATALLVYFLLQFEQDNRESITTHARSYAPQRIAAEESSAKAPSRTRRVARALRYPGTPHRRKTKYSMAFAVPLAISIVVLVLVSGIGG